MTALIVVGALMLWCVGVGGTLAYGRLGYMRTSEEQGTFVLICLVGWPLVLAGLAGYRLIQRYQNRA